MSEKIGRPYLSIIVPARNEENRLPPALNSIGAYLRRQPFSSEVIVVENGSSDDTAKLSNSILPKRSMRMIRSPCS